MKTIETQYYNYREECINSAIDPLNFDTWQDEYYINPYESCDESQAHDYYMQQYKEGAI